MKIGYDGKRAVQNFTGLGNYSRYVIDSMAVNFPQNDYVLYAPKERENAQLDGILERAAGRVVKALPKGGFWRRLSSLWRVWGVTNDICSDGINIFHGISNELPLNIKGRVKCVVTIHDLIFLKHPECYPVIDRWIYNFKFKRACRNADHVIAVSECTKRDIVRHYGINPGKISVIYQGCDAAFSADITAEKLAEVRARYSLPQRFILSVGTMEARKNLLSVVKALPHLPQDIHLVAVGRRTKYTDEIDRFVADNGLQQRVHLLHGVPFTDLPALYRCADVFAYMSLYEGFGIPILEALYSSLPVVAATGSCLEEAGGEHSLYVAPFDIEAIAAAIETALQPNQRRFMVERGLEWAHRFTPQTHARETQACYMKILNEK